MLAPQTPPPTPTPTATFTPQATTPTQTPPSGVNLLQNPGAEAGTGSASGNDVLVTPGWTTTSNFTVVNYGAPGYPSAEVSQSIGGGLHFFSGGPGNALSSAMQSVDVSPASTTIDAGTAGVVLSAYLGGYASQGDSGTVAAIYLDAAGQELGRVAIGPVSASDRGRATTLLPRSATAAIPPATRTIRVVMTATRTSGSHNDGYFDNVSLEIIQNEGTTTSGPVASSLLNRTALRLAR